MTTLSTVARTTLLASVVLGLAACNNNADTAKNAPEAAAKTAEAAPVVIYTNADEEAQQAMKKALFRPSVDFQGGQKGTSFKTSLSIAGA